MQVEAVLERLKCVQRRSWGWTARCPAHMDENPSLSVAIGDGRVVLTCHAGCRYIDILEALGLGQTCLRLGTKESPVMTKREEKIVARYDYCDLRGEKLYQVVRYEPKGFAVGHITDEGKLCWGFKDERRVLYHCKEVVESGSRHVIVVEGEKDVDRLRSLGLIATTMALGAGKGKWRQEYIDTLAGRDVSVIADNDEVGLRHAQMVVSCLSGVARSVRLILLPGLEKHGDVSDWLDAGNTKNDLIEICKNKEPAKFDADGNLLDALAPFVNAKESDPPAAIEPAANNATEIEPPDAEETHITPEQIAARLSDMAVKLSPHEWIIFARGRISDLEMRLDYQLHSR